MTITVTASDHEKDEIKDALEMYEARLKAVSFMKCEDRMSTTPWDDDEEQSD